MKTTHELAQELQQLPNVRVVIEGWVESPDREMVAVMTGYDRFQEQVATIMQAPKCKAKQPRDFWLVGSSIFFYRDSAEDYHKHHDPEHPIIHVREVE